MAADDITGYYTYRSFRNDPVGDPNDVLFGEGELLIFIADDGTVTGTLAFPADAGSESKSIMDLKGAVIHWAPVSLRLTGNGRAQTAAAGFDYDYDCRVAHRWDKATPPQRQTLVGTVRRNNDHGAATAGVTASFIAVQRDFVEPRTIEGVGLIENAVQMLGGRAHRLRHTVWHTLRDDWHSLTADDHAHLKTLGWFFCDPPLLPGPERALDLTNGAGEDFLYMHRRMIRMLHDVYANEGHSPPAAWKTLPGADTPQFVYREESDPADPALKTFRLDPASSGFMVPPPNTDFMTQVEGKEFFRFNKTARGLINLMGNVAGNLRSSRVAAQLPLGAYGNLIEFTVHNWMHMRWATLSRDPQSGKVEVRNPYDIDPRWDDLSNDYLGDFHSSHVNPIFWRLHGWVDDCIEVWFKAHGQAHPSEVKSKEVRGISWFEPGKWVLKDDPFDWPGADHHGDHSGHHADDEVTTLERVIEVLREAKERSEAVDDRAIPGLRGPSGSPLPSFAQFEDVAAEF